MPRLNENQRNRAVGMLQARMAQNTVPRHFLVHRDTIQSIWRRFQQSGNTQDRPSSGRPRVTSRQQDNHIRLVHLRHRFQTASWTARSTPGLWPISGRTVLNRMPEQNIRPRRPAVRSVLLQRHRIARLAGAHDICDSDYRTGPIFCSLMNPDFIWMAMTAVVVCIVALGSVTRTLVLCNVDNLVEVALWCGVEYQHVEGPLYKLSMEISLAFAIEMKLFSVMWYHSYRDIKITSLCSKTTQGHTLHVVSSIECRCIALASCFPRFVANRARLG